MHTANVEGWPDQVRRYRGTELDGWLKGYAEILEWEGLERLLYYRRQWQQLWNEEKLADKLEQAPDNTERMSLIKSKIQGKLPHINYMVDKGWRQADKALIKAIKENKPLENAQAFDAAISLACAEAAVISGKEKRPVKINCTEDKITLS
jgi:hypothetical protein